MKPIFLFIALIIYFSSTGQSENYNTHIKKANKVVTNGGKVYIFHADSVIVYNTPSPREKTKLWIADYWSIYDTVNNFNTTALILKNPDVIEYFHIDLTLKAVDGLLFRIQSKEKVKLSVSGVEGKLQ